jgi:hypothetical protein
VSYGAAARAEDGSVQSLLSEHLGADAAVLPVASGSWSAYDQVNVQAGPAGTAQGTMQVTAMVAVCRAVTVTDKGCEHGSSRSVPVTRPLSLTTDPLLTSVMRGERPETWYLPGGNRTEKVPEDPTETVTRRCPVAVKVTVPGIGRSPGCRPPGPSGPPSISSLPAR